MYRERERKTTVGRRITEFTDNETLKINKKICECQKTQKADKDMGKVNIFTQSKTEI